MTDTPEPTTGREIAELRAEVADLRLRVAALGGRTVLLERDLKRVASPAARNEPSGTVAISDPDVFEQGVLTGMWGYGADVTPPPPDTPPGGPPPE